MTSTTHPDATAFAARFLANPDDRLGRLVFADWLEERGDDSGVAWADYIRTQAEMETLRWNDPSWDELTARATESGRRVRATLTVRPTQVEILTALHKLIPPTRCVVRVDRLPPDSLASELLPESVAREHLLVPLTSAPWEIYCACPQPADRKLHAKLTFILNRNVTLFGIGLKSIPRLLDDRYSHAEPIRFPDGSVWVAPEVSPADAESGLVGLLAEMVEAGVVDVSFHGVAGCVRVAYSTRTGWRQREPMTMDEFGAVFAGIRAKMSGAVPARFTNRIEFWHTIGGRRYHGHGNWFAEESFPRVWFTFSPVVDHRTRLTRTPLGSG